MELILFESFLACKILIIMAMLTLVGTGFFDPEDEDDDDWPE